MAYTEKRTSGKWQALYRDASGNRRSAGTYTHKGKAERAGALAEANARRNMWHDPEANRRTWGEWATEWFPSRGVEQSTAKTDGNRRAKHLEPRWGDVQLGAIRRHDVKLWAAGLRADGMGASTVQRVVHLLSASLTAAVDLELIDSNPAARIVLPKGQQAVERFLTLDEYDAVIDSLPTTRDQLVVAFLAYTGVRYGEMAGLHVTRLDTARGYVRVVETYDGANHLMKPYAKDRDVRTVPVPAWLCDLLDVNDSVPCNVPHTEGGACRGRLVFSTDGGAVLDGSKWGKTFRAAVADAGIGHTRIHDLRHTFASWLLQAGVSIQEVARLMGHSSTATTERYRHLGKLNHDEILSALARP